MIVLMEYILTYTVLALLGLILGSFAGATVWRLRARQLVADKASDEEYDEREYKQLHKLTKNSLMKDRSVCLHCSYELKWYDLLPLVSWISLRGKCRSCRKPIGYFEPVMELSVALFFVLSYAFWPFALSEPYQIVQFVIWLVAGVALAILAAYDAKWFLLPSKLNYVVVGLGVINAAIVVLTSATQIETLLSVVAGAGILSGIYAILYLVSKGKFIGFGDIILGLGLALLLADWQLAFIALCAANLVGCLIVIPGMLTGKLKRTSHVPFGPLLIAGWLIAGLWGFYIIDFYSLSLL